MSATDPSAVPASACPSPAPSAAASTITVTGTGAVSGKPDRLHLGLEVEVRRPTAADAYLRAADAASRVFDALDSPQMPPLTRATQQIGLRAEILWGENQEQRVTEYVASQNLTVSLEDLAATSDVLDGVVEAGSGDVRINSLSFGFSDPAARAALAQVAAWQDALERATRWAELAGLTLGAVENISEGNSAGPSPAAPRLVLAQELSMPIEPGEAEVVRTVTIRWRVNPAG